MFDHVTLRVKDIAKAKQFYGKALETLGYRVLHESADSCGLGQDGEATLWLVHEDFVTAGMHLAFKSPDRRKVDAFHAAALAAGGRDNGKPGLREHYGPTYYAAFARDPDGNNIEAVCYAKS